MATARGEVQQAQEQQTLKEKLRVKLEAQRQAFQQSPPDYRRRMEALETLRQGVLARRDDFVQAISEDFGGRAREETLLLECFPLLDQIKHAQKHLKRWMRPQRVGTGFAFLPGRSYIIYQPLGVVGILSAWNYPLLLSLSPLVDALAAGNHVMLKPSELAPRTAELLKEFIQKLFPEEYVTVIIGGVDVAQAFVSLPFDHILFTGSTRVGRLVMRAASENLTPVTLELGGKCPTIIHRDFDHETAARRIWVGKLYNAGQTCIAPDYVLLHRSKLEEFVELSQRIVPQLYPNLVENPQYTRVINQAHYERLTELVNDACAKGAHMLTINPADEDCTVENKVFPPTLVWDVRDEMLVMQEEIFGPVLPLVPYETLEEAIKFVNARPRPLALYYFDENKKRIDEVLKRTISGGATINDVLFHIAQQNLPFGGVGPSGIGHYHGVHGFRTFSKARGVFHQSRLAPTRFIAPPYRKLTEWAIQLLVR
jgi:coniferyl-aldehyde dehydrogenase